MTYSSYGSRRSPLVTAATWAAYIFGYLVVALVVVDWIWDDEPNAVWRWIAGLVGLAIIVMSYFWRKSLSWSHAIILLVLLAAGGFLTFWTIAGLILALVTMVLVLLATTQET